MQSLPSPLLVVKPEEGPRGGHVYKTWSADMEWYYGPLPSVTGKLDIIGGNKTRALMGWAVKESLKHVEEQIRKEIALGGTSITDEFLDRVLKAGRARPEKVKEDAADLGTRVHNLIDEWILTGSHRAPAEDERIALGNFFSFVKSEDLSFLCGDLAVASAKYLYGGRLDAIATKRGKLYLMDWKTSNAIRDDYALQVAGYSVALKETYGLKANGSVVCRFDKTDPKAFEFRVVSMGQATKTWVALNKFHREYMKGGVWK